MALAFLWTNSYLSEISADLATIRAAGIDVIVNTLMGAWSDADVTAYLNALNVAGLKATLDVRPYGRDVVYSRPSKTLTSGELTALDTFVDKWKTHAATWGYYADDEGGINYPIATRQQVYDTIKAAHPAGQVLEVHYVIIDGAYSPDVHDVFAIDRYPFYYTSVGGCVSRATGLVDSVTKAAFALDGFKDALVERKAALDAAGETNYFVCMQAFGHGQQGTNDSSAMPPASGIWRTWGKVREAGFDGYGAGWFLWKSNDAATLPFENLNGVGEDIYTSQRAEIAAIAEWPVTFDPEQFGAFELSPLVAVGLDLPTATYCVKVAGNDVTELVDLDTLHRSMSERGEASATIDIPVASENEVPANGLARDAVVEIDVDGGREWLGQVVAVHKPKPQDLSYVLDCAGGWDTLHHCAPWCFGFVETRYDTIQPLPATSYSVWGSGAISKDMSVDTDGQVLGVLPAKTDSLGNDYLVYLHLFDGLLPWLNIHRVTFDYTVSGRSMDLCCYVRAGVTPWSNTNLELVAAVYNDAGSAVNWTTHDGTIRQALIFTFTQNTTPNSATADATIQIRNLRIYCNRSTAPRVDEIVVAIDAEARTGAPAASAEAIGSPLTAFMLDPFMTPADGIAVALTKAAVPPLCGVIANQLVIKNRPTTPPDATRLWTVSEQLTPGLEWGVEVDEEQSVDYVGVSYATIGDATIPDGTPRIAYYPSAPPNDAARTGLIDGGDLTAAEAAFYAQQGYYFLHKLVSGPVTIPYVVRDANGAERPADVIRAWDWVQNVGSLDAATAGPFLVSEVEHQGHIASLTIGAADAYAYNGPDRMPTKGRYVGAHKVRSRTTTRVSFAKYWAWKHRKDKHKPGMPKRHAKYGTIRGFKWTDVEGRYV